MLHIQSPQFSNSSKCNLSNFISPTNRNKRAVSADNYSINGRANSCKKLDSPSKVLDKMRKKSQNGEYKNKSKQIISEMNNLRQQYMNLKIAYKQLMGQKMKRSNKDNLLQEENILLKQSNTMLSRNAQNMKGKIQFLESEIQRIKKQSLKLIQVWQFRIRKLEQSLSQNDKRINQYRQCLKSHGIQQPRLSSSKKQSRQEIQMRKQRDGLYNSLAAMSQSLIMGTHDEGLRSNMSQYISVSLASIVDQNQFQTENSQNNAIVQASQQLNSYLSDITLKSKNSENKKSEQKFKKFKKQICKKIQVHIDEKNKQFIHINNPKTPLDRKINKSTKSSKLKLKKQEQNAENKSSKKKMSAKLNY